MSDSYGSSKEGGPNNNQLDSSTQYDDALQDSARYDVEFEVEEHVGETPEER